MSRPNRRTFLQALAGGTLLAASASVWSCDGNPTDPHRWIKANDNSVDSLLLRQQRGNHPFSGGIPDRYGIFIPMTTALFLQYAASAYSDSRSRYYGKAGLEEAMLNATGALLAMQHPDGSIDLPTTNFHSTPDTAFVVEPLALARILLAGQAKDASPALIRPIDEFLKRAGQALRSGGIHTPNHRWVVCMALAYLYKLYGDREYLQRMDDWLKEGIDLDADGQFDERSTAVYSPLSDRCLISLARLAGRDDLLYPVRRNLESTLYLLHPDGTLVTEGSRRQDQFRREDAAHYYYPYAYMARKDADPRFARAAHYIAHTASLGRLKRYLIYFQTDAGLWPTPSTSGSLPRHYVRRFQDAGMLRIRRGQTDATFLAGNPVFFSMRKGSATLGGVRLATAFFGKGQFSGEQLKAEGNAYRLDQELEGPYYQPFSENPADAVREGPWEETRKNRTQSEIQHMQYRVELRETENGFQLDIDVRGTDRVPLVLELAFAREGILHGVNQAPDGRGFLLPTGKFGRFRSGRHNIRFGPGLQEHGWTQLRGALPPLEAGNVYLTGFTPARFRIAFE